MNVTGPDTAALGDRIQFRIEVTNQGDQPLDNVRIVDHFDAGLQHADGETSPMDKVLGRLESGETKLFAVTFLVRHPGQVCHVLEVSAPGGHYARSQSCVTVAQPRVTPQPDLQLTMSVVPQSQVGQQVLFTANLVNSGTAPLTDIRVSATFDAQFRRQEATPGFDSAVAAERGEVLWRIPRLEPGEATSRSVLCRCDQEAQAAAGRVTVTAAENVSRAAEASVRILANPTLQPGPGPGPGPGPAPQPVAGELQVEITELSDPIAIDASTTYMITVRNSRDVPDQDVRLTIQFPPGLQFQSLVGLGQRRNVSPDGRTVSIEPFEELRARESLRPFRVLALGRQAGDHTLQVTVTSRLTPQGVQASEVTTVTAQ